MHLFARWLVNAVALFIAAWLVPGIRLGAAGHARPSHPSTSPH
jgi:uncharacterized membrane protein YvlD (DUF360 family)